MPKIKRRILYYVQTCFVRQAHCHHRRRIHGSLSVHDRLQLPGRRPAQGNQKPTVSIPPADITDAVEDFTKELEPLKYEDGEQGESPFYRVVGENNELFYEVQPKGEDEPDAASHRFGHLYRWLT